MLLLSLNPGNFSGNEPGSEALHHHHPFPLVFAGWELGRAAAVRQPPSVGDENNHHLISRSCKGPVLLSLGLFFFRHDPTSFGSSSILFLVLYILYRALTICLKLKCKFLSKVEDSIFPSYPLLTLCGRHPSKEKEIPSVIWFIYGHFL